MDALVREWQQTLEQYKVQLDDVTQVRQLGQSSFKGHLLKLMQDVRGMMAKKATTTDDPSQQQTLSQQTTTTTTTDPLLSMPFLTSLVAREALQKSATSTSTLIPPSSSSSPVSVPDIVWMWWEHVAGGPPRPVYIEQCLESVRVWNAPHMQLNLVSPDNLARFVPGAAYQAAHADTFVGMHAAFSRLATVQQRARYFSVWALYNFGGTWLDVDTIALSSLRPLVREQNARGKQLTIWQRPFTRAVDLGAILVVPHHPVFRRWLLHLHAAMDRQANASFREPVRLDPLSELGAPVLTEMLWDYAWAQREQIYRYDVRPMDEVEPIDLFHNDAWVTVPPPATIDYAQWWERMKQEHARSPYLVRFSASTLPLNFQNMSERAFRESRTCLAWALARSHPQRKQA